MTRKRASNTSFEQKARFFEQRVPGDGSVRVFGQTMRTSGASRNKRPGPPDSSSDHNGEILPCASGAARPAISHSHTCVHSSTLRAYVRCKTVYFVCTPAAGAGQLFQHIAERIGRPPGIGVR